MLDNKFINYIFLFSCFIVSSGALIYSLRDSSSGNGGDPFTQLFLSAIYIIVTINILINFSKLLNIIRQNIAFTLLLILSIVSIFWSIHPVETLTKSASLIGITSVGIFISYKFNYESIINIYYYYFIFISFISLIFIFIIPDISISSIHEGAWMGVFTHKNILGKTIALSVIVSFIKFNDFTKSGWDKFLAIMMLIISLLLLYKSNSITSITSLAFAFLIYLFFTQKKISLWIISIPILVSASLLIINFNTLIEIFGRDLTLSGRLFLWITLFTDVIPNNLLLGYGYNAFWNDLGNHFTSNVGWAPSHAHNGFIQVLVDLGIVGLFLLLVFLTKMAYLTFKRIHHYRINGYAALILIYFITYNISEISFITGNDFMWLFFIVFMLKTNMDGTTKIINVGNAKYRLIKKETA